MRKLWKQVLICCLISAAIYTAALLQDHERLHNSLIRLHVVANSDSEEDQNIKLQVRDAVLTSIQEDLSGATNLEEAKRYLEENLPKIQETANQVLTRLGVAENAVVSLRKEAFDIRHYDTFSLPSGIYESLRIVIGDGAGKNWWCVAFPALCLGATSEEFEDAAVGAGFSQEMSDTLAKGKAQYELRFFLLDAIGQLENLLFEA